MLQTSTTKSVHNGRSSNGRDWRHQAACRDQDPELFHPVGDSGPALLQISAAKAVCARCPVVAECLSFALKVLPEGVAGGLTAEERAELRHHRQRASHSAAAELSERLPARVDEHVVAALMAGERVSGASRHELAQAAVTLHQTGHGSCGMADRLGVAARQVQRFDEGGVTHRAAPGTPVVRLACTGCQLVWEPDLAAFGTGNTGCPRCGGWTWIAQLGTAVPDISGGGR
jgi:WhiB family redox-sensing transcriptional regulator